MYLAGLKSPILFVADTKTHKVVEKVGPFGGGIRPFTVNAAQTLAFVNVNELLGFEIGDLKTGKMLHRVEVEGFKQGHGQAARLPQPRRRPDARREGSLGLRRRQQRMHVFDTTVMPPKQIASIKLREQPGWVTFSLDGKYAYPSTGEVIDTKTKKIVAALTDEEGREVHSEKMVEIVFADGDGWSASATSSAWGGESKSRSSSGGTPMALPTGQDICPYDDWDGRVACEHFLGRTLAGGWRRYSREFHCLPARFIVDGRGRVSLLLTCRGRVLSQRGRHR